VLKVMDSTLVRMLTDGFRDARVVVVGGRGGVGAEVVRLSAELGSRVVISSRSVESTAGLPIEAAFKLDLGVPASIESFADAVADHFGAVDILVNTAGSSVQLPQGAIESLEDSLIIRLMQENCIGPMMMMRNMAPILSQGDSPVIVNLSSIAAVTGGGSNMAYAGAKAALDTISRSMAKALAPAVRIVSIAPSALDTGFVSGREQGFLDATINASALKRLATTQEIAVAVLCAARLLTATTGATIVADAGRQL
jgi:NAD(P)-dependent dehydrogenase (short-subunit alcohol dehydrogenase family)